MILLVEPGLFSEAMDCLNHMTCSEMKQATKQQKMKTQITLEKILLTALSLTSAAGILSAQIGIYSVIWAGNLINTENNK